MACCGECYFFANNNTIDKTLPGYCSVEPPMNKKTQVGIGITIPKTYEIHKACRHYIEKSTGHTLYEKIQIELS